jgi:hypothetical protein
VAILYYLIKVLDDQETCGRMDMGIKNRSEGKFAAIFYVKGLCEAPLQEIILLISQTPLGLVQSLQLNHLRPLFLLHSNYLSYKY